MKNNIALKLAKWFIGSKVVDANGKPLKMYHGTSVLNSIQEFDPLKTKIEYSHLGYGIYFTDNTEAASQYTTKNQDFIFDYDFDFKSHLSNIRKFAKNAMDKGESRFSGYISMLAQTKNIPEIKKLLSTNDNWKMLTHMISSGFYTEEELYSFGIMKPYPQIYPVFLNAKNPFDLDKNFSSIEIDDFLTKTNLIKHTPKFSGINSGAVLFRVFCNIVGSDSTSILKKANYDSIHRTYSLYDGPPHNEWVVFNPNQIKSIFSQKFSKKSNNISEQKLI